MFKFGKIIAILISFIFLTGFIPVMSLLGPSFTAITSGNIYKAGGQFLISNSIKKKTGKNSLDFVKDTIENKENKKNFDEEFKKLVEKRVYLTRQKMNLKNINQ